MLIRQATGPDTQLLNQENARFVREAARVNIFSENTGWTFCFCYDANGNTIARLHSHEENDFHIIRHPERLKNRASGKQGFRRGVDGSLYGGFRSEDEGADVQVHDVQEEGRRSFMKP